MIISQFGPNGARRTATHWATGSSLSHRADKGGVNYLLRLPFEGVRTVKRIYLVGLLVSCVGYGIFGKVTRLLGHADRHYMAWW